MYVHLFPGLTANLQHLLHVVEIQFKVVVVVFCRNLGIDSLVIIGRTWNEIITLKQQVLRYDQPTDRPTDSQTGSSGSYTSKKVYIFFLWTFRLVFLGPKLFSMLQCPSDRQVRSSETFRLRGQQLCTDGSCFSTLNKTDTKREKVFEMLYTLKMILEYLAGILTTCASKQL